MNDEHETPRQTIPLTSSSICVSAGTSTPAKDADRGTLSPGDVVDARYRIVRLLAIGGQAEVYEARHRVVDMPVALKLVLDDPDGRLTREAFVANQVVVTRALPSGLTGTISDVHPNVVRTFDHGTHGELRYLVTELLVGESLQEWISRNPVVPPEESPPPARVQEAADYLAPVLFALSCAHVRGIYHRDVKPPNVFVAYAASPFVRVVPKLIDWGLASAPRALIERFDPGAPATTGILGTLSYLPPEVVAARAMDPYDARSEVWSIGMTLHQAVTGRLPWSDAAAAAFAAGGAAALGVLHAVAGGDSSSYVVSPLLPPELVTVISRCLAPDPARRWRDVDALRAALGAATQ